MRTIVSNILERIYYKDMRETMQELFDYIAEIQKEIAINESCNIRTEETDSELKKLMRAKIEITWKIDRMSKEAKKSV